MTTITEERQRLAEVGMRLIRRETWGSRYDYRNARTVHTATKQFVHVSVTNPSAYNSHAAHVRAIENIGIVRFPATGISYNRVILFGVDTAYEGQPMGRRGAHTVNDFQLSTCTRWGSQCPGRGKSLTAPSWNLNYNARAYVYGALCEASATDSVVDTFARIMAADRRTGLVTMDASIHGHRCVSAKSCPCGMWPRMHDLADRIDNYLEDDMPTAKEIVDELFERRFNKVNPDSGSSPTMTVENFFRYVHNYTEAARTATTKPLGTTTTTPRQAWQRAELRSLAVLDLVQAQQPLIEAAAAGEALTGEQVQEIAASCAAAIPDTLADDVIDELGERLTQEPVEP